MHKEYLALAKEELDAANYLFKGRFYREAASRAYYSMFHASKALLYLRDSYPKSHAGVISQFGKEFVRSGEIDKVYSDMIARAETLRAKADYDVERKILKEEVMETLEECEKFLNKVHEVVKGIKKIDH